ncbi:MAG TPA: TIGR01777 family oxidoreductase [Streptosporangiaceae bacterium]|nr:TIGR01777 family oxidoreductase [Streptosporangiaceae bacterium]
MSIVHTSVVNATADEVFAWHGRPGALTRLLPPWQPVRIGQEAGSLRDGRAVLLLPGRVRWVAEHQPAGYDPPRQFVDQLVSAGLSSVLTWRHTHLFRAEGERATRVTDEVDTPVPEAALRQMFGYRHRQLAADLVTSAWARDLRDPGAGPLTVAITGASGLIGTALTALLSTGGHRVIRLVRHPATGPGERQWDTARPGPDLLTGVDAVVHLAGASIAGRFTEAHRRAVRDSRVGPTRRLAELAAGTDDGPRTFVSASAIGYYGADRGDEVLTEKSPRGEGFLAGVVADWEAATAPAEQAGLRVARIRTGIALSPRGGTLRLLYPLFEAGLGGRIGSGRQWLSWIGLDDLADVYLRALVDPRISGPVNAVAPAPVRNGDFTRVLASVLRRPAMLPVPGLGPRLLLGSEGARELAEASQRVRPDRLLAAGHQFRYARLEPVLRHLLGKM